MKDIISSISFIVIALNEEHSIQKCLLSISSMNMIDCEIICVDSGSTDKTLSIMRKFGSKVENFRIFTIEGYANAAIARNIGIKHAKKEILYFVDGDIELKKDFILEACDKFRIGYDAVTGSLLEYQYTSDYSRVIKKTVRDNTTKKERLGYISGGCFLIKKALSQRSLLRPRPAG